MNRQILMLCAAMVAMAFGASAQNEVSPDWVDLGLPSGVLWATHNVGAESKIGRASCRERV